MFDSVTYIWRLVYFVLVVETVLQSFAACRHQFITNLCVVAPMQPLPALFEVDGIQALEWNSSGFYVDTSGCRHEGKAIFRVRVVTGRIKLNWKIWKHFALGLLIRANRLSKTLKP